MNTDRPPPGMEEVARVVLRALDQFRAVGEPRGAVISGERCGRTQLGVHLSRVVSKTTWLHASPSRTDLCRARGLVIWDDAILSERRVAACFKAQVDRGRAFWLVFCNDDVPRLSLRLFANFDENARRRAFRDLLPLYRIVIPDDVVVGLSRGFDLKQCDELIREAVELTEDDDDDVTVHHFVRASRKMRNLEKFEDYADLDSLGGDLANALSRLERAVVEPLSRGRRPRNAVVYGPTGSGKTAALRWISREAVRRSISVIQVHCAELLKPKLGETEKSIARVFENAKQKSPCLLVFDNIDLIGAPRGHDTTTEGSMDRAVGTLLMLIDGFTAVDRGAETDGVVGILAATGALHRLDEALLRPGRLGEVRCALSLPNRLEERLDILVRISKKIPLDDKVSLPELAEITAGFSGAELRALLRDAVALALRDATTSPLLVAPRHVAAAYANISRALASQR